MNLMIISDEEPTPQQADAALSQLHALHGRAQTMAKLIAGHIVSIVDTSDANRITVTVGGNVFACPRNEYPSEELVACVVLAVNAGEHKNVDVNIPDFDRDDLMLFTPGNKSRINQSWHAHHDDAQWAADANLARKARELGKEFRAHHDAALRHLLPIEEMARKI